MSNLIPGNQKHMTLNDRLYIEESLNAGSSFKDIARFRCKRTKPRSRCTVPHKYFYDTKFAQRKYEEIRTSSRELGA